MKVYVDAGSTSTKWCLVQEGEVVEQFQAPGVNPVTMKENEIGYVLFKYIRPRIERYYPSIDLVEWYGAGCRGGDETEMLRQIIVKEIGTENVGIDSDMVGAAKAALGDGAGICCILGTGSNSCLWDGRMIVDQVPSLGYILGDEGSGNYLGRQLINSIYKRQMPEEIKLKFEEKFKTDLNRIIKNVYNSGFANQYLAATVPFIHENMDCVEIKEMVVRSFVDFFEKNVMKYRGYTEMTIGVVGSVAYVFADELKAAALACECTIDTILQNPLDKLIFG